jgi:hypothetical protein
MGNQKLYIEEQTLQWSSQNKNQKDKTTNKRRLTIEQHEHLLSSIVLSDKSFVGSDFRIAIHHT